ncbi:MAG: hypothetical protein QG594_1794 [Bacteroidota bacterium]|nr:hypothetical protein [Bacteroidota bacterium]
MELFFYLYIFIYILKTSEMTMIELKINDETSRLQSVLLGIAASNGPVPLPNEAYDPKSLEHILAGTYPTEADMVVELESFYELFIKYNVTVFRPELIENYNQIFVRDIGFVIDGFFIKSNILPEREAELKAIEFLIQKMNPSKVIQPPEEVHIEGGDVLLWRNYIFVGTYKGSDYPEYKTARTNMAGVQFIKDLFPGKIVKELDLIKSKLEARDNALHLDCCFQPVGKNKAIIYKRGFREESDYLYLVNLFGKENLFHIKRNEMYNMYSNVFSIDTNVVVSDVKFKRLNEWLRANDFIVEEISYSEISKQEGLFRCTTLPLLRK